MTRENKLALVVGFGLILFVGILISDHFSTVRTQTPANLANYKAIDPLASNQAERPSLIDLTPARQQPIAVNPGTMENLPKDPITDSARPEHYNGVYPGGYPNSPQYAQQQSQQQPGSEVRPINPDGSPSSVPGFVHAPTQPDLIPVNWKVHEVKSGESFFAICRQYYSDTNQVKALAKFNSIDDPASLRIVGKIRIPTLDELNGRVPSAKPAPGATNPQSPTPTNTPPVPPSLRIINETQVVKTNQPSTTTTATGKASTYTVKAGDSLASIAQKFLGSSNKWRKLYDLNRQVVEDPDDVKVGTVLKLL